MCDAAIIVDKRPSCPPKKPEGAGLNQWAKRIMAEGRFVAKVRAMMSKSMVEFPAATTGYQVCSTALKLPTATLLQFSPSQYGLRNDLFDYHRSSAAARLGAAVAPLWLDLDHTLDADRRKRDATTRVELQEATLSGHSLGQQQVDRLEKSSVGGAQAKGGRSPTERPTSSPNFIL